MMKAVVLEITGSEATVMTHEGDIIGISDQGYDIGQEITIEDKVRSTEAFAAKIYRFMPAIAAAAAALVVLGGGSYAYCKPFGTVSLDVNPSIEYTINRFDRVIDVNGVNDDGSDILAGLSIKNIRNKDIEAAIEATIEQIEAEGYMEEEEGNYVVITANTGKEKHTEKLIGRLDRSVALNRGVNSIAVKVSDDELDEAHKQGISAGKKIMVDRLEEISEEEIDREEWGRKSVRDIVKEYDRIKDGSEMMPNAEEIQEIQQSDPGMQDGNRTDQNPDVSVQQGNTLIQDKDPDGSSDGQKTGQDDPKTGRSGSGQMQDEGNRPQNGNGQIQDEGNRPQSGSGQIQDEGNIPQSGSGQIQDEGNRPQNGNGQMHGGWNSPQSGGGQMQDEGNIQQGEYGHGQEDLGNPVGETGQDQNGQWQMHTDEPGRDTYPAEDNRNDHGYMQDSSAPVTDMMNNERNMSVPPF
jgi:hypothetical protein